MNFQHRTTEPHDFPACMDLMYDRFLYDAPRRRRLTALWRELLENDQVLSAVIEGVGPDGTRRIMGFGLNAFITDSFAAELRAGTLPSYMLRILERHEAGKSPLLPRAAIRAGNTGVGLSVAALGVGHVRPDEVPPDVFHGVMGAMLASSQQAHRGYRINDVLTEAYGPTLRDMLLAGGFHLRTDYREFFSQSPPSPPPEQWPYLLGLTRDEAVANPFCTLAFWFQYNRPRFGFTPGQQGLLGHALAGKTDDELAVAMSISPWTVKKRWQTIYAHVESISPGLLPPEGSGETGAVRPSRGVERRRHLLHYLREHMEELRPH